MKKAKKVFCFLCMKKANRDLTDTFKQKISEDLQVSTDFSDTRVPFEICFGCHTELWEASKGEKVNLPCSTLKILNQLRLHRKTISVNPSSVKLQE